jgi:hypothetical protein
MGLGHCPDYLYKKMCLYIYNEHSQIRLFFYHSDLRPVTQGKQSMPDTQALHSGVSYFQYYAANVGLEWEPTSLSKLWVNWQLKFSAHSKSEYNRGISFGEKYTSSIIINQTQGPDKLAPADFLASWPLGKREYETLKRQHFRYFCFHCIVKELSLLFISGPY